MRRLGASTSNIVSGERVQYGDLVAFHVEDKGFLAVPSSDEPIPLAVGPDCPLPQSQLRAARPQNAGSKVPRDFWNRCVFEVLSESGAKAHDEPVTYGSMVMLRHVKTGLLVLADSACGGVKGGAEGGGGGRDAQQRRDSLSETVQGDGHDEVHVAFAAQSSGSSFDQQLGAAKYYTRLKNATRTLEAASGQFYLRPRYSVRAEGDLVRDQDRVILESCRFKGLQLLLEETSPVLGGGSYRRQAQELMVGVGDDAYFRPGWQVYIISRPRKKETHTDESQVIHGGDCVRFSHQQIGGHLIARVDDGQERCSRISPLGMVYRKLQQKKDRTVGVFLRRGVAQSSALSIFQVIPHNAASGAALEWDSLVRLRHLITGQYLALRQEEPGDSPSIRMSGRLSRGGNGHHRGASCYPCNSALDMDDSTNVDANGAGRQRTVVATLAEAHDLCTLFRLQTVRDSESMYVTSKSKCVLQHHETGAHLSLGSNLATSPSKGNRPPRLQRDTSRRRGSGSPSAGHHVEVGGHEPQKSKGYWEFESDSIVYASWHEDADAEVYRVSIVNPLAIRNILYALRFAPIMARAVELVRDVRVDPLNELSRSLGQSIGPSVSLESTSSAPPRISVEPPQQLSPSKADKTHRGASWMRFDEDEWRNACMHMLHALKELSLWQAGEVDVDGEISVRRGAAQDGLVDAYAIDMGEDDAVKPVLLSRDGWTERSARNLMLKDEDTSSRDVARKRRELLRDCNLLEHILMFVNVSFQYYHGRAWCLNTRLSDTGSRGHSHKNSFDNITDPLINACATSAYSLLRDAMNSNFALTVLYLSGINSMVRHISLGWNPPIEEILAAAIECSSSATNDCAGGDLEGSNGKDTVTRWSQYRLSTADLYQLGLELHRAYTQKKIRSTSILKLLANVCAPGGIVDQSVQSFLANLILHTTPSGDVHPKNKPPVSSLLFSLRPESRSWAVHLSLHQERPTHTPDEEEVADYHRGEEDMMLDAFARYDEDGNGTIDKHELGLLLQDLGLQSLLIQEVQAKWKADCSFKDFVDWWNKHRYLLESGSSHLDAAQQYSTSRKARPPQPPPSAPTADASLKVETAVEKPPTAPGMKSSISPSGAMRAAQGIVSASAAAAAAAFLKIGSTVSDSTGPAPPSPIKTTNRMRRPVVQQSVTIDDWPDLTDDEVFADPDVIFHRWIDLKTVLCRPRFRWEAEWIRASVRLLIALCRERNLEAQTLVSKLVPIDAILHLLRPHDPSSVSERDTFMELPAEDKGLFCDLLRTSYIDHDLVLAAAPLLPLQTTCLSVEPEVLVYGEIGRVFNSMTQHLPHATASANPDEQRDVLWHFLLDNLRGLERTVVSVASGTGTIKGAQHTYAFLLALTRLTKALLVQGFFEADARSSPPSSSSGSTPAHSKVRTQPSQDSAPSTSGFAARVLERLKGGGQRGAASPVMTYDDLESTLCSALDVLNRALQRNGGMLGNYLNPEAVKLQHLRFEAMLHEPLPLLLKTEMLKTLAVLQDMRLVKNVKSLLWSYNTSPALARENTVKTTKQAGPDLRLGKPQEQLLETGFTDSTTDGEVLVNSVLDTTVHKDKDLLGQAYNLLYRHSIQRVELMRTLRRIQVTRRARTAITRRIQARMLDLFDKYEQGFFRKSATSCDTLRVVLSVCHQLCYRNWDHSLQDQAAEAALDARRLSEERVRSLSTTHTLAGRVARHFSIGSIGGALDLSDAALYSGGRTSPKNELPSPAAVVELVEHLAVPFVDAKAFGLDQSIPNREQQSIMQDMGRRVIDFLNQLLVAQELQLTPNDNSSPRPSPLGHSDVTLLMPRSPLAVLETFTAVQKRTVDKAFMFLFHACRANPEVTRALAVPNLKLLRTFATEFVYAMRLLAEVGRQSLGASRIRISDAQAILRKYVGGRASRTMQLEAFSLMRSILEAGVYEYEDDDMTASCTHRTPHTQQQRLQSAVLADITDIVWADHSLLTRVALDQVNDKEQLQYTFQMAKLANACLRAVSLLEASSEQPAAHQSSTVSEHSAGDNLSRSGQSSKASSDTNVTVDTEALRERIFACFPCSRLATFVVDARLPLPLRCVYLDILRQQSLSSPQQDLSSATDMMRSIVSTCTADLKALAACLQSGSVKSKELDAMSVAPYLVKSMPSFILAYLSFVLSPTLGTVLASALSGAHKAIEKEMHKSRYFRSHEDLLPHKIHKACKLAQHEVIVWRQKLEEADEDDEPEQRPPPPAAEGPPPILHRLSSLGKRQSSSKLRTKPVFVTEIMELIHVIAELVLTTPNLEARWASSDDATSCDLTKLLVFSVLMEAPEGGGGWATSRSDGLSKSTTLSGGLSKSFAAALRSERTIKATMAPPTAALPRQDSGTVTVDSLPPPPPPPELQMEESTVLPLPMPIKPRPTQFTRASSQSATTVLSAPWELPQEGRFLHHLTQALLSRRMYNKTLNDDKQVIERQLPVMVEEVGRYVLRVFDPAHTEGASALGCSHVGRGSGRMAWASWLGEKKGVGGLEFRDEVKLLAWASQTSSIIKHVLWRRFCGFLSFYHDTSNRVDDDFVVWSRAGGVYIEQLLLFIRYRLTEDEDCCLFFLDVISGFLEDDIARIRREGAARYDAQKLIKMVQMEVAATQRRQQALQALDSHVVLMAIVAQAAQNGGGGYTPAQMLKIMPRVLHFGARLMATGNRLVQTTIMDYHDKALSEMLVQRKFCVGLRNTLRSCRYQVESFLYLSSSGGQTSGEHFKAVEVQAAPTLALVGSVFDFISSLSAGHNLRSRTFLREQRSSMDTVNLVVECASLAFTLCSYALSLMTYVESKPFTQRLAPIVPSLQGKTTRRYIAWHDRPLKFKHLSEVLKVLTLAFAALTEMSQGPCHENQVICERLCPLAGEILEFCGLLHLELPSQRSSSKLWPGGDPMRFYEMYIREYTRIGESLGADEDSRKIREALPEWRKISERSWFTKKQAADVMTSKDILGVELSELAAVCQHAERSSLKFLCAMLEGQNPHLVEHVRQSIDAFILYQNMASLVRSSQMAKQGWLLPTGISGGRATERQERHRQTQEAAVLYLTILSTLASLAQGELGPKLTKVLEEWQESHSNSRVSRSTESVDQLVASVEIIGRDGNVQQVYFPVPQWIKTFWQYPLVQKAKHDLIYQVKRDSPEEKIIDFYDRMTILTKVMRRQEHLHKVFRLFHGLVGGKSVNSTWIPSSRFILLLLTLLLNMYLCTRLYYEDQPPPSPIWVEATRWSRFNDVVKGVKILHMALCASLLFTAALNSSAGDATHGYRMRICGANISIDWIITLLCVASDVKWLALMGTLSCIGYFVSDIAYAFCIVDVIPQIRLMKFLVAAIKRNVTKIWLTVLLCLVVIYLFATIAYMTFRNMYGFNGHGGCNTLATCFKLHLDYGITQPPEWDGPGVIAPKIHPGYIHSAMASDGFNLAVMVGSAVFNLSYIIVVNLVLSAIISGLIIDTFSQMRSENEAIEEDMLERCFVCSIDRDLIEQSGVSFRDHIHKQHNMWKYFWFRTYLNGKDPLTYTGPEMYSAEMFQKKSNLTKFFPLKKSLIMERKNIELKSKSELDTLVGRVTGMEKDLSKLYKFVERFAESSTAANVKATQEQHKLAAAAHETMEMVKSVQGIVQQLQHHHQQQQPLQAGGHSGGHTPEKVVRQRSTGRLDADDVDVDAAGSSINTSITPEKAQGTTRSSRLSISPPSVSREQRDASPHPARRASGGGGGVSGAVSGIEDTIDALRLQHGLGLRREMSTRDVIGLPPMHAEGRASPLRAGGRLSRVDSAGAALSAADESVRSPRSVLHKSMSSPLRLREVDVEHDGAKEIGGKAKSVKRSTWIQQLNIPGTGGGGSPRKPPSEQSDS